MALTRFGIRGSIPAHSRGSCALRYGYSKTRSAPLVAQKWEHTSSGAFVFKMSKSSAWRDSLSPDRRAAYNAKRAAYEKKWRHKYPDKAKAIMRKSRAKRRKDNPGPGKRRPLTHLRHEIVAVQLANAIRACGWTMTKIGAVSGLHLGCIYEVLRGERAMPERAIQSLCNALSAVDIYFDPLSLPDIRCLEDATPPDAFLTIMQPTASDYSGLYSSLDSLEERSKKFLESHFLEGLSYRQVGKMFGVSHERVRQIIGKSLRNMRHPERFHLIEEYEPR